MYKRVDLFRLFPGLVHFGFNLSSLTFNFGFSRKYLLLCGLHSVHKKRRRFQQPLYFNFFFFYLKNRIILAWKCILFSVIT